MEDHIKLPVYRQNGRALGVLFENLTVRANEGGIITAPDPLTIIHDIAVSWPSDLVRRVMLGDASRHRPKTLLHGVSGVILPGETMLVLGRPGAGCSTLLRQLSNHLDASLVSEGHVQYGSISAREMARHYGSEIAYSGEDDTHHPSLKVKDTLHFALRPRRPGQSSHEDTQQHAGESSAAFAHRLTDQILEALGILHTKNTIVGNAFVRGVSGGERKRVSLAEILSIGAAVVCWDNPLRGLDSTSALRFLRLLKALSEATGMCNIVTAYQVSESMYRECFDKLVVLYSGHMIYSGAAGDDAKEYFTEELGFECHSRQTTPDFLTAVTSKEQQRVKQGHLSSPPLSAEGLADAFARSRHSRSLKEAAAQFRHSTAIPSTNTTNFRQDAAITRHSLALEASFEPQPLHVQVTMAMRRYYQLTWGDRGNLLYMFSMALANALINGSAFYMSPATATGSFLKSGAIFFTLIYFSLNALVETASTVRARGILKKQHFLGIIHPGAVAVAQNMAELPTCFVITLVFAAPYYFLVGLHNSGGSFWTFQLLNFANYASALSLFRMLGAWSPNAPMALLMAGLSMPIILSWSGYAPTWPTLPQWGHWIRRITPTPFALEAMMASEFRHISVYCEPDQLIPSGSGYDKVTLANQGCVVPGAGSGTSSVQGEAYVQAQFGYNVSNIWRNLGIIAVFWLLYTTLTAIGLTRTVRNTYAEGAGLVFKTRTSAWDKLERVHLDDEESRPSVLDLEDKNQAGTEAVTPAQFDQSILSSAKTTAPASARVRCTRSTFTFSQVSYFLNVNGTEKQLLSNVCGYVKPGQLTALMGASGAGKTTLLDALAQRKREGDVVGDIRLGSTSVLEDPASFSRACGFCMQQDIHEPRATVREALEFSARMRRPAGTPVQEINHVVQSTMQQLELNSIADALIGVPGEWGLGVEERKRVTIGVELVADPSGVLFLDEPTSGLDSQASYYLVSLLKRLASNGLPIICTIHQPSAVLFEQFDHILLLAPGGRTVYFGETGPNSSTVARYFSENGASFDSSENVAEAILEGVIDAAQGEAWHDRWNKSAEKTALDEQLRIIQQEHINTKRDCLRSEADDTKHLSWFSQFRLLAQRHSLAVWRNGSYVLGRLVKAVGMSLTVGFLFYQVSDTLQGLQNHLLGLLVLQWVVPASAGDLQELWYATWSFFDARERSGVGYDPLAFCGAILIVEVPLALVIYTLAFVSSWFPMGLPDPGFGFLEYLSLGLFGIGFPLAIASMAPNITVAGYANGILWCVMATFAGVAIPYQAMMPFYRDWLYWANPLRYWLSAGIASVTHSLQVLCDEHELVQVVPPEGRLCDEYLQAYVSRNGGYVRELADTTLCGYCPYSNGDDYAATFRVFYRERWRDWAIFLGFCGSTLAIAFLAVWIRYRVVWKGWGVLLGVRGKSSRAK